MTGKYFFTLARVDEDVGRRRRRSSRHGGQGLDRRPCRDFSGTALTSIATTLLTVPDTGMLESRQPADSLRSVQEAA